MSSVEQGKREPVCPQDRPDLGFLALPLAGFQPRCLRAVSLERTLQPKSVHMQLRPQLC